VRPGATGLAQTFKPRLSPTRQQPGAGELACAGARCVPTGPASRRPSTLTSGPASVLPLSPPPIRVTGRWRLFFPSPLLSLVDVSTTARSSSASRRATPLFADFFGITAPHSLAPFALGSVIIGQELQPSLRIMRATFADADELSLLCFRSSMRRGLCPCNPCAAQGPS
jgi:hypothetical protein